MPDLTAPEKKILEAAKKVFERSGYAGARMQQIADEAGISKASLHYYFRSKEKLFQRIFDETIAAFLPLLSAWEDDSPDWENKLRKFISGFFSFLKTGSLLFLIREINRNPGLLEARRKKGGKKKNRFIAYFRRMQEAGKIKKIDPRLLYMFMHSLCAYPILNSALFRMNTGMSKREFNLLMDQYPALVAGFLIEGIKKQKS